MLQNNKLLFIAAGLLLLASCSVTRQYERPADAESFAAIRTDRNLHDTTNIAHLHWSQLFTDEILQRHIREALSNNPDAAIAHQQMSIAQSYLWQARAAFAPTLSVSPGVSYSTQSQNTQFGRIIGERQHNIQYELGFNLAWEADLWGRLRSNRRAAIASFLQSEAATYVVKSNLVAEVADTYFRLLSLDEQRKITDSTIAMRESSLVTSRALKEAGTITEVAIQQSEAQVLNAQGILVTLDNQIKVLENYFSMLLGKPAGPVERSAFEDQEISTFLSAGVPAQLLANRPDVIAAEYGLINAFELTNVARASFYPAFTLGVNTGLQSLELEELINPYSFFANVAASLSQPILQRRQLRTQQEVSEAGREIAYQQYRSAILTAGREVSDALYNYDTQRELATIKQNEFQAYSLATEYSGELLNYGMANYLEVLRASEMELNARLAYINARYGTLNAVVQLYQALGGGWRE